MFLFVWQAVYTQHTWFVSFDPEVAVVNEPAEIFEVDNAYYVSLHAANSFIPVNQNGIIKFSTAGEHIWTALARYPSSADSFTTTFNLLPCKDTSIYFLSSAKTWDKPNRILLNKFLPDGSIAWDKTVGLNNGGALYSNYQGNAWGPDSSYMVMARATPNKEFAVFGVDTAGNKLWETIFLPQTTYAISNIIALVVAPDSTIYLTYSNNIIGTQTQDYVAKLDATGHPQKYFLNPQSDFADFSAHLAWHPNGNLVYLSHRNFPSGQGGADKYGGTRVQMLTPDLDTLWTYLFQDITLPYGLTDLNETKHISISESGKILTSSTGTNYMHLGCFSPEGKLLWWRELALEGEVSPGYTLKHFYSAVWTSDGGILADGYMYGTIAGGYKSKIFLMKLDSVGCLEPGCTVSVVTSTKEAISLSDNCWTVSPIPATDAVNVKFHQDCHLMGFMDRIMLFDLQGRLVVEQPVNGHQELSLSTASIPNGIYFLQAGNQQIIRLSKKLVIQR